MSLSGPEREVIAGVRQSYEAAIHQSVEAWAANDIPAAERWAWIADSLLDAVDESRRPRGADAS